MLWMYFITYVMNALISCAIPYDGIMYVIITYAIPSTYVMLWYRICNHATHCHVFCNPLPRVLRVCCIFAALVCLMYQHQTVFAIISRLIQWRDSPQACSLGHKNRQWAGQWAGDELHVLWTRKLARNCCSSFCCSSYWCSSYCCSSYCCSSAIVRCATPTEQRQWRRRRAPATRARQQGKGMQ